ncbi:MAG TPA: hypothetical protein VEU50_17710 [Archangium sp.]|nr:hypothetical protein [Archangium sp.]
MKKMLVLTRLASGLLVVGLAGTADAASGFLPTGSEVCTDRIRSDNGVYTGGHASSGNAPVTWTVLMSSAHDGPEDVVFQAAQWELPTTTIRPPSAGTFFFRTCLNNTANKAAYYRFHIGTPNFTGTFGPHTAVLGSGGVACGEFAGNPARLVASSNVDVEWSVRTFDGDMNQLGEVLIARGTSVDQVVVMDAAVYLDACATNRSGMTATLAFDLQ